MQDPRDDIRYAARELQNATKATGEAANEAWHETTKTTKEVYDETRQRIREFADDYDRW